MGSPHLVDPTAKGRPSRTHRPAFLHVEPGELVSPGSFNWPSFRQSWEDLPRDTWMADGGTYRRRRYAAFQVQGRECLRLPHQPHYQRRTYNSLNGGVQRWFEPLTDKVAGSLLLKSLITDTAAIISRFDRRPEQSWKVEAHQFRIEAAPGGLGLPTPEGMHQDGREWVLLLYIGGSSFVGGQTRVETSGGVLLLDHRLSRAGEGLLLDDRRVRHETSAIQGNVSAEPEYRDTLVLTFESRPAGSG